MKVLTSIVATVAMVSISCGKGGGSGSSGSDDDGGDPVEPGANSSINIAVTEDATSAVGALSASATGVQILSTKADGTFAGATITVPPGALSVDTDIKIEQGEDIATDETLESLNIDSTVESSGVAVVATPSVKQNASLEITVAVPLPAVDSEASLDNLVAFYKVENADDSSLEVGVVPKDSLAIELEGQTLSLTVKGKAGIGTTKFGVFQSALTASKIAEKKTAATDEAIKVKSADSSGDDDDDDATPFCEENTGATDFSDTATYGDGSATTPFLICTESQLRLVASNLSSHFRLEADINLDGKADFTAIGDASTKFTGTFDGLNHTITGITIGDGSAVNVGMFGWVGSGAVVKNLRLADASVTGSQYTGGIAGRVEGTVENVEVAGTVAGNQYTGGIVGMIESSGKVKTSVGNASVSGDYEVGGVAGQNSGAMTDIISTGQVSQNSTGQSYGGIVGQITGSLSNCYASGSVNGGTGAYGGGLAGTLDGGSVSNCFTVSSVTTSSNANFDFGNIANSPTMTAIFHHSGASCSPSCSGAGTGVADTSDFHGSSHTLFGTWDFSDVWQSNASNYPTLK